MQFDIANRLFFRLYQSSNLLHKNGTRQLGAFGATTQQWAVLGALARPAIRARGMTVKDLVAYLMLSRQNLTAVLDRLESRSWVERVKDPDDGRNRLIRMTATGEGVWLEMQAPIKDFYNKALGALSAEETAQLLHLLDRLRAGLSEV